MRCSSLHLVSEGVPSVNRQKLLRPASALLWLAGSAVVLSLPSRRDAALRLILSAAMTTTIVAALDDRSAELREVVRICSAVARQSCPPSVPTDAR